MNTQPRIVSIAVHYNSPEDCTVLVKSLIKSNYNNHIIIIVDNCSEPILYNRLVHSLLGIIEEGKCEIIKNKSNVGFGGGINFGFDYAVSRYKPDYLHVINTDAEIINKNYLLSLASLLEQDKSIGIIGPAVLKGNRRDIQNTILPFVTLKTALSFKKNFSNLSYIDDVPTTRDVDCVNGVCFLMPAKVFNSVKGFDTSYFMYGEEQDLCFNIYKKGYRRVFWSGKSIIHYGAEKEENSMIDWRFVHVRKNQVKYLRKHEGFTKSLLLATLFSVSLLVKLWKGGKTKDETPREIILQYFSCVF